MSDDFDISIGDMPTMGEGSEQVLARVDRYELIDKLGQGAFGAVYLAKDTVSEIKVAIKTLPPELNHSPDDLEGVRDNYKLVSGLAHPNIAQLKHLHKVEETKIIDQSVHIEKGHYLVIMEYVEGSTLRNWVKQYKHKQVPVKKALEICSQVAEALDFAHDENIIHRDIKPGNVMIDRKNRVKLLDFGLAAEVRTSMSRLSMDDVGSKSGTRPYMPPEQLMGRRQDNTTDQYALAVLFHELVLGEVPFQSIFETNDIILIKDVVTKNKIEPLEVLSDEQNKVLIQALAKDKHERFETCSSFIDALKNNKSASVPKVIPINKGKTSQSSPTAKVNVAKESSPTPSAVKAGKPVQQKSGGFKGLLITLMVVFLVIASVLGVFGWLVYQNMESNKQSDIVRKDLINLESIGYGLYKYGNETGKFPEGKGVEGLNVLLDNGYLTYHESEQMLISPLFTSGASGLNNSELNVDYAYVGAGIEKLDGNQASTTIIAFTKPYNANGTINVLYSNIIVESVKVSGKNCVEILYELNNTSPKQLEAAQAIDDRHLNGAELPKIKISDNLKQNTYTIKAPFLKYANLDGLAEGSADAQERQKTYAQDLPLELSLNKTHMTFRLIPAGEFNMSNDSEAGTPGYVFFANSFYMAKFEVTQAQWKQVMGQNNNPSYFKNSGNAVPVDSVTWGDCQRFIQALEDLEGLERGTLQLPLPKQWEYACRAGTTTKFYTGDGIADLDKAGWFEGVSASKTHQVGQLVPNAWGLYDMHGNVLEYCKKAYDKEQAGRGSSEAFNYSDIFFLSRGGSWSSSYKSCSADSKSFSHEDFKDANNGFRLVLLIRK